MPNTVANENVVSLNNPTFGGVTTLTGKLALVQGSASQIPMQFTAGAVNTTPVAGVVEFDGTDLYITNSTPTRKKIGYADGSNSTGSIPGNSGTTTAALGLKTATTTVAISASVAPSAGQVLIATSDSAASWQTPQAFPAGTRMLFAQTTAPTGWVQDTTDTANNRMMRVVNGATGNSVGGSDNPISMTVVPSHTHTLTVDSAGSHTHGVTDPGHFHSYTSPNSTVTLSYLLSEFQANYVPGVSTSNTLSKVTGISIQSAGAHGHTGTISTNSGAANWAPRYIDIIICTKS
jgi:hypothetical protein